MRMTFEETRQLHENSFFSALDSIRKAIINLPKEEKQSMAVAIVDDWVADVMLKHFRSTHFGLPVLARLSKELIPRSTYLDTVVDPHEQIGSYKTIDTYGKPIWRPVWRHDVKRAAFDRLQFWQDRAARFEIELTQQSQDRKA